MKRILKTILLLPLIILWIAGSLTLIVPIQYWIITGGESWFDLRRWILKQMK